MIRDLARAAEDQCINVDVAVVGAGIAGLFLATRLAERGLAVTVLESGARDDDSEEHPLNRVAMLGRPYAGATRGRARCLGGTSTRWGGALIPLLAGDLVERPHVGMPAWPVAFDELAPYLPSVERAFGVDEGPYGDDEGPSAAAAPFPFGRGGMPLGDRELIARYAKWPNFKRRNVASLFRDQIASRANLCVWLNATVTGFAIDAEAGRITGVTSRAIGGRKLEVTARHVVLCAGAIESTRLLLLLDRQYGGRPFAGCEALGRYFHDHISLPAARLEADRPHALNRLAGFRFRRATMRSLRFELAPQVQRADGVGSAFGHIACATAGATSFDALRDLLRGLQRSGRLDHFAALRLLRDIPYLMRLGYWRFALGQLHWPSPATYDLHVVAEQLPRASNRITLASETDAFGLPLAAIDWQVEANDLATIRAFARRFDDYWRRHGLAQVARVAWQIDLAGRSFDVPSEGGDIFHPGGTTRMGVDKRSAVIDRDLETFAVPNLSVAATSVFPSGGSANPTLTLILLACRLADRLAARYG